MHRLTHTGLLSRRRSGSRERGAVASIVAVFIGGMVLLGCAALAIDVGSILYEKRQLQSGADAASLALAKVCQKTPAQCMSALMTATAGTGMSIQDLNNKPALDGTNGYAADGANTKNGACVSAGFLALHPGTDLPPCSAGSLTAVSKCPPLPPGTPNTAAYVEVHSSTRLSGGSTVLPPIFAQTIGGTGSTLESCARALWGPLGSGGVIPLSFSTCEYKVSSDAGFPTTESVLGLNANAPSGCMGWVGHDLPGGFGWLDHDATCLVELDANNWADTDTGVGAGNDCKSIIESYVGKVIAFPIFDCLDANKINCAGELPNGTHSYYHIKGWAAFQLTGVEIASIKAFDPVLHNKSTESACKKGPDKLKKCVFGWFLPNWSASQGSIDWTATDFGVDVVQVGG